jgi:hypothetical protein
MADRRKMYLDIAEGFKKAYPNKKPTETQNEVNAYWASIRNKEKLADVVKGKLIELQKLQTKSKLMLMTYWAKVNCILIV